MAQPNQRDFSDGQIYSAPKKGARDFQGALNRDRSYWPGSGINTLNNSIPGGGYPIGVLPTDANSLAIGGDLLEGAGNDGYTTVWEAENWFSINGFKYNLWTGSPTGVGYSRDALAAAGATLPAGCVYADLAPANLPNAIVSGCSVNQFYQGGILTSDAGGAFSSLTLDTIAPVIPYLNSAVCSCPTYFFNDGDTPIVQWTDWLAPGTWSFNATGAFPSGASGTLNIYASDGTLICSLTGGTWTPSAYPTYTSTKAFQIKMVYTGVSFDYSAVGYDTWVQASPGDANSPYTDTTLTGWDSGTPPPFDWIENTVPGAAYIYYDQLLCSINEMPPLGWQGTFSGIN